MLCTPYLSQLTFIADGMMIGGIYRNQGSLPIMFLTIIQEKNKVYAQY